MASQQHNTTQHNMLPKSNWTVILPAVLYGLKLCGRHQGANSGSWCCRTGCWR